MAAGGASSTGWNLASLRDAGGCGPGDRWYRCARPPARLWHPSGMRGIWCSTDAFLMIRPGFEEHRTIDCINPRFTTRDGTGGLREPGTRAARREASSGQPLVFLASVAWFACRARSTQAPRGGEKDDAEPKRA